MNAVKMLRMLDLLSFLLKFFSILTFLRLLVTAFGWEFGITRQYLRLLELLFYLGEKRIEKVESKHRIPLDSSASKFKAHESNGNSTCKSVEEDNFNDVDLKCTRKPKTNLSTQSNHLADGQQDDKRQQRTLERMRRVSSPNGPPVFLLDDYLDDELALSIPESQHEFHMVDACLFVARGLSVVTDDQVTKRFSQEELKTWNLLTRTNAKNYQFMSSRLGMYWLFGMLVRYAIMMPLRIVFTLAGFLWLTCSMAFVGLLPHSLRDGPYCLMSLMSFRMLACGITSRLKFHNRQYRAQKGDICVANHTSPIDVVLLACDNCYALVGQRHGGLLGMLEHALSRATNHVWFDRGEMRDRQLVTKRLKEHVNTKTNLPVLIFPEGTCINNSAVMMFRKGTFETTDRVCPVALKYDSRFGDPFWNSSKQSYVQYLLLMMSSWAIKCDVWYLPPMERQAGETSVDFANRVKAEIAKQGGLVDLAWDGQLKRSPPKELWKHQQQEDYVRRLKLE